MSPSREEVLSRSVAFSLDAGEVANEILPFLRKNQRVTRVCLLQLVGLTFPMDTKHAERTWDRLSRALTSLGCQIVGELPDGQKIYEYSGAKHERCASRITALGFSTDPGAPPPVKDHVEVCRAWIREHCRPTAGMSALSSTTLKHKVEQWSSGVPDIIRRVQFCHQSRRLYAGTYFYVTVGALMQAMKDEGYVVRQQNDSPFARFNVSVRKTGKPWQGRPPVLRSKKELVFVPVVHQDTHGSEEEKITKKLSKFLDAKKQELGDHPFFSLREAAKGAGVKMYGRSPPRIFLQALRVAGCCRTRRMEDGRMLMRWCRYKDMYRAWQTLHLRDYEGEQAYLPPEKRTSAC